LRHASRSRKLRAYLSPPSYNIQIGSKRTTRDILIQRAEAKRLLLFVKKNQFRRCFPEILNSFRVGQGLMSKDFINEIAERIKQFLIEEGEPQNIQTIFTDLVNIYDEVPRLSLRLALRQAPDIIAIKKGTYALKEWGFVPAIYERKEYEINAKNAVLDILEEATTAISIMEIKSRIIIKYGTKTSAHLNTIRGAIERIDGIHQDEFGNYKLIKEEVQL
jgi:hypothetical protein